MGFDIVLFLLVCHHEIWFSVHLYLFMHSVQISVHLCICLSLHFIWNLYCFSVDLASYVTRFQWDRAKYPTAVTLKNLTEIISRVKPHLA